MKKVSKKLQLKRSSIFAFRRSSKLAEIEAKKIDGQNELLRLKHQTQKALMKNGFNDSFAVLRKRKNMELASMPSKDEQIEQLRADLQAQCDLSALSNEINSRKMNGNGKMNGRRSSEGLVKIQERFSNSLLRVNEDQAMQTNEDVNLQLNRVKMEHQTKEIARLKKVILENYKELERNEQKIEDLKKENGEKQKEYVKQIKQDKKEIEKLKKGIDAQNDFMGNSKKSADAIIKKKELQIDSLSMQLQESNDEISKMAECMEGYEGKLKEKDGKIFELTQENVAIANGRDANKQEIERLRSLISGQEREMNELQKKYAAQSAEQSEKISELATLHDMEQNTTKQIIKKLEDEIEANKKMHETEEKLLKAQIEANETDIGQLQNEIEARNQQIENENAKIDELQNHLLDYNELKQRLIDRDDEIAMFKSKDVFKQIAHRREQLEDITTKYHKIKKAFNEQEAEIEKLRAENEENKDILQEKQEFEESVQRYNEELMVKYRAKLEKRDTKIANLKKENAMMRKSSKMNAQTIDNLWVQMGKKVQDRDELLVKLEKKDKRFEKLKRKTEVLQRQSFAFLKKERLGSIRIETRPFKTCEKAELYVNKLVKKAQNMKGFTGGIWTKNRSAAGNDEPAQIEFSFGYLAEDIMQYPGVVQLTEYLDNDKRNIQRVKVQDEKNL